MTIATNIHTDTLKHLIFKFIQAEYQPETTIQAILDDIRHNDYFGSDTETMAKILLDLMDDCELLEGHTLNMLVKVY